jgi:voltage-gated potassium channel
MKHSPAPRPWQYRLHSIIFEANTPTGKWFDIVLIGMIISSVLVIVLESLESVRLRWEYELHVIEWFFTAVFTIEYILRIISISRPLLYIRSFYGCIDLLSILPTWLSLFVPGTHFLASLRILRVMRIFRVFKLIQYVGAADMLFSAIRASMKKIIVFLLCILSMVTFLGSIMYLVEGPEHGYTSIPKSMYWALVTLTTVGYGDISPQTPLGQIIASIMMMTGYAILAVPTGIVTVEMSKIKAFHQHRPSVSCLSCALEGHDDDAKFCRRCGTVLDPVLRESKTSNP